MPVIPDESVRIQKINEYIVNRSLGISHTLDNTSTEVPLTVSSFDSSIYSKNKEVIVANYYSEIENIIQNDIFEDGEISQSQKYMEVNYTELNGDFIKEALMKMYYHYFANDCAEHVLTGVATMLSAQTYENMMPQGQIMVLGLLQHKNIYLRDKAIETFEKWNSKKGIPVLESLQCDQKWLQNYVNKVIKYLKRDGVD